MQAKFRLVPALGRHIALGFEDMGQSLFCPFAQSHNLFCAS